MSLVNDMLRDLDKRKQLPVPMRRIGVISYPDDRRTNSMVVVGLVALCVVAGFGSGYLFFNWGNTEIVPVAPSLEYAAPVPELAQVNNIVEAKGMQLDISEEAVSKDGFSLRLRASNKVDFTVLERNSYSLKLQLQDAQLFAMPDNVPSGVSIIQMPNATVVEIELNNPADFQVYEDSDTTEFDIVMAAAYRNQPLEKQISQNTFPVRGVTEPRNLFTSKPVNQQNTQVPQQAESNMMNSKLPSPEIANNNYAQVQVSSTAAKQLPAMEKRNAPARVNRELSQEQQDSNTSQKALVLVQQGRLYEAYEQLLTYLGSNPAARISRETLATVLFAQNELPQARIVVEEGLQLAPNYAPFKKIMARLLMQDGEVAQAMELMRNVPPELSSDPEYFELLASLYQQSNEHSLAVTTYQELLRTNAQQGRWWAGLAISLEAQGRLSDAKDSFQQALLLSNLDTELRQYSQKRVQGLTTTQ